jgi:hypothetical protein
MDIGDDLPEISGESSADRSFECASSKPVAFVFEDPTAGAAFCPSPPTCSILNGRKVAEFAVDRTDSVGLPGRSNVEVNGTVKPEMESRREDDDEAVAGDKTCALALRGG